MRERLPRDAFGFETAAALARLVLRQAGLREGRTGPGLSFLINLEALFERTVVAAFREAGVPAIAQAPVAYQRVDRALGTVHDGAMALDLYCPQLASGPLVVDAKYKTSVSSANLQQMVTYCFGTGARRAVLVFPAGHVPKTQRYRFPAAEPWGAAGAADEIVIDVAALRTDAQTVEGWRAAGQQMVTDILGAAPSPAQPAARAPLDALRPAQT